MLGWAQPPVPVPPVVPPHVHPRARIKLLQKFIESFEYNYTGTNFFKVRACVLEASLVVLNAIAGDRCAGGPIFDEGPAHRA